MQDLFPGISRFPDEFARALVHGDEVRSVRDGNVEVSLIDSVGSSDENQITVCDLTGTGVQDTAIAMLAYGRAMALGIGTEIEN